MDNKTEIIALIIQTGIVTETVEWIELSFHSTATACLYRQIHFTSSFTFVPFKFQQDTV